MATTTDMTNVVLAPHWGVVLADAVLDATAKASVALISGVALVVFSEGLYAMPVLCFGAALFATRLVIKLSEAYACGPLESLHRSANEIAGPFARVRLVAILVLVVTGIGAVWAQWAAGVVGGSSGVYTAITIETHQYEQRQGINRTMNQGPR